MLNRRRKIFIGVVFVLMTFITGWYVYKNHYAAASDWGAMPPTPVITVIAKTQGWQPQLQATGTLNPTQGVMLKSEVAGRITKIYFTSGQQVNAGDPLLEIDPGILEAQLNAAIAKADLSRGDYQRAVALFKRGALDKQDLDTALANQKADAANVEQIKAELGQNILHAPFKGKLGLKLFNLGDYINQGQALVNLQNLDPLRVDFSVPENVLGQIAVGDVLQIQSDAFPNQRFTGNVSAIDSAINSETRTIALRAIIANPQQKLLPGSFVQVTLFAGKSQTLVTVPQIALVYDAAGNYVYTVAKGKAIKTPVMIAQQNDTQVAISRGLKAGDMVITEGQLKITDGAPVVPVPSSEKPA